MKTNWERIINDNYDNVMKEIRLAFEGAYSEDVGCGGKVRVILEKDGGCWHSGCMSNNSIYECEWNNEAFTVAVIPVWNAEYDLGLWVDEDPDDFFVTAIHSAEEIAEENGEYFDREDWINEYFQGKLEEYKEQAYDWYVDEFDPLEYMEEALEDAVRTDMINAENEERENW